MHRLTGLRLVLPPFRMRFALVVAAILAVLHPVVADPPRNPALSAGCVTDACNAVQSSCKPGATLFACLCSARFQSNLARCKTTCSDLPNMDYLGRICARRIQARGNGRLVRVKRSVEEEPLDEYEVVDSSEIEGQEVEGPEETEELDAVEDI